jgi:GT2 family glycosyltransferase
MNPPRFAFVILHYQALDYTRACVQSCLNAGAEDGKIVVVDNCSPNGSGKTLQEEFATNPNVVVLLNPENGGFAAGNNVGYQYAKHKLNADFLVMLNNDVTIEHPDFAARVLKEFAASQFFVLSPKQDGVRHAFSFTRPYRRFLPLHIFMYQVQYALFWAHLVWPGIWFSKLWNFVRNTAFRLSGAMVFHPQPRREGLEPLGSCYIFSPLFLATYEGLDGRTTFYYEEDILFAKMTARKQKLVYNPEIQIFHHHHASTKSAHASRRKQLLFQRKNYIHGLKVYQKVLNEEGFR